MKSRRDRIIAATAVALVAVLGAVVVRTVLDAQRRGRDALERNQNASIQQYAASMDQRLQSALESLSGFAQRPLTFGVGDPADQAVVQSIQDLIPEAEAGIVLVDVRGTISGGTLLQDPKAIGTKLTRPGIDQLLETGEAAILPSAPGLTTDLPTLAIAWPALDPSGAVRGAFVFESVVAPDSDFNKEIAELRQGETGVFTFVDGRGTVIVATDPDLLGKPFADESLLTARPGLRRIDDLVVGIADVPSAGWRLIFTQGADEFEAGLGERVQTAVLLLIVGALLAGGVAFVAVLRRLRAERDERRRMEAINATREEFISIVSHELRTPVAGVLGFLESTMDHWDSMDDSARRHAVVRACSNARRLQALTRDVLDTSSLESGELTYAFDIVDLTAEVSAAVTAEEGVAAGRQFALDVELAPAWVRGDPDRIQQVLLNLLDNAVNHSPRDTPVEVGVSVTETDVVIAVRDHGAGLSEADLTQVFTKWARGRSTVKGTGLGLYLCRRIVEAHDGRIWAENHPAGGALFRFSLPLTTAPAEPVPA